MKKYSGLILTAFLALFLNGPLIAGQPKGQSANGTGQAFNGEIMDSLCAKNGSHDEMMAEMKSMGHDKKTCTMTCVKLGAKYVLYDASTKTIYALDDQDKAEAFAGQTVRVQGTLQKNKIKVGNIEAAGSQASARP
jgi:hypothetical protein